jgi:3-phosphoglycerate kinase
VDVGEGTLEAFRRGLAGHRTVVWNGPMGVFEHPSFAHGTRAVAQMLAQLTDKGAVTVVRMCARTQVHHLS